MVSAAFVCRYVVQLFMFPFPFLIVRSFVSPSFASLTRISSTLIMSPFKLPLLFLLHSRSSPSLLVLLSPSSPLTIHLTSPATHPSPPLLQTLHSERRSDAGMRLSPCVCSSVRGYVVSPEICNRFHRLVYSFIHSFIHLVRFVSSSGRGCGPSRRLRYALKSAVHLRVPGASLSLVRLHPFVS